MSSDPVLSVRRRVRAHDIPHTATPKDSEDMWGWNARNKGGSTRTIAAEEYRKSVAREAAPRRRLSKARRKLMSKLSRFLSTSPTSIEILIADDNPETRGPLAELIEATAMANPNLPPIPLVVYQTDLKSDILAAMNHARISIAIVSESLLDDFQAQLMTELPSDSSSTVFVAYSSNPAGPVFGACCRPPPPEGSTHPLTPCPPHPPACTPSSSI